MKTARMLPLETVVLARCLAISSQRFEYCSMAEDTRRTPTDIRAQKSTGKNYLRRLASLGGKLEMYYI